MNGGGGRSRAMDGAIGGARGGAVARDGSPGSDSGVDRGIRVDGGNMDGVT